MKSNPLTLGLIGGLGPAATIFYYQELLKSHAALGLTPNLLIAHADVRTVLRFAAAGHPADLANYLAGFLHALKAAGAGLLAIAAVTPHLCVPDLARQCPAPFVDIVEETSRSIRAGGWRRVALFGTRYTMETGLFGRLPGVEIVPLDAAETEAVHRIYLEIVETAAASPEQVSRLREIAQALRRRHEVEAIVLAGTELSLVLPEGHLGIPAIDCARLHVAAIMRKLQ